MIRKLLQAVVLVLASGVVAACDPGGGTGKPVAGADQCPEGVIGMDPGDCVWQPDPAIPGQRLLVCTVAESNVDPSDTAGVGTPKK